MVNESAELREFRTLMELMGWTAAETARQLNVTPSAVSQILKGKNRPTFALEKLRTKVIEKQQSRPAYVLKPEQRVGFEEGDKKPKHHGGPYYGTSKEAPLISWASAGYALAFEDQGVIDNIPTKCKDPNTYCLEVQGDSMSPTYLPRDILVIAPNSRVSNGALVVAKTRNEEVFFKTFTETKEGGILLTSINPGYPVMKFEKRELFFVHAVHSVIRTLLRN